MVIHYSAPNPDFEWKNLFNWDNVTIREDSMRQFLGDSKEYFILDCESVKKVHLLDKKLLVAYSPEETVQRAKSKLGENKYKLSMNNCEHFAIWCKTGIHKSTQVDNVLRFITKIPIIVKIP